MTAHRFLFAAACCAALLGASAALADSLVFTEGRLSRDGGMEVIYRLDAPATGTGTLAIEWTDAHGRLVDRREMPVAFDDATDARFTLDLGRVAALGNRLRATLTLGGNATETRATFFVPPADDGWSDYQVFIWQIQDSAQYAALRELGVSAGKVYAARDGSVVPDFTDPLLDNDLPWYIENIATDPQWDDCRQVALEHGLRAAWSSPIRDIQDVVLGAFVVYFQQPTAPSERHRYLIQSAARTAATALFNHQQAEARKESEDRLRLALR